MDYLLLNSAQIGNRQVVFDSEDEELDGVQNSGPRVGLACIDSDNEMEYMWLLSDVEDHRARYELPSSVVSHIRPAFGGNKAYGKRGLEGSTSRSRRGDHCLQ